MGATVPKISFYILVAFGPLVLLAWTYSEWRIPPYPTSTTFTVGVGTLSVFLAAMSFLYGQFRTQVVETHSKAANLANERLSDKAELEGRKSRLIAEVWFPSIGTRLLLLMLGVLVVTVVLASIALVKPSSGLAGAASASYDIFAAYLAAFLFLFVVSLWKRIANAEEFIQGIAPAEPRPSEPPATPAAHLGEPVQETPAEAQRDGFSSAERNFDWLDTIFLSVLLGSGFVLGLNRLTSTSWGSSVPLALQPENFVRLLSLVLVYIAVSISVVFTVRGKVESPETLPTENKNVLILLFSLNLVIMFVYLVQFALFTVPGFVLELTALNFLLFIGFDVARVRRRSGRGAKRIFRSYIRGARNIATLSMAFVFLGIAFLFHAESDVTAQIVLVVIAIAFTVFYRILKGWLESLEGYFKRRQQAPPVVPS